MVAPAIVLLVLLLTAAQAFAQTVGIISTNTPVNYPPVANPQEMSTLAGIPLTITLTGDDANGDALTFSIVTDPSDGTLSDFDATTGMVIYTPDVGFSGSDSFTFTVNDGIVDSDPAIVTITVENVNHPPLANAGADQSVACTNPSGAQVTLNGTGSSDLDGDSLTFTWTGLFGTARGPTPTASLPLGTHTITLTVDDGKGRTASDQVVVTVQDTRPPVPDLAPLPTIAEECSAHITSIPTSRDNCAGTITGTTADPLNYSQQGTFTITWTFSDGNGNSSTQTQAVIVKDVTPPMPALSSLPTVTGECSAVISSPPTATDNCTGRINGTTADPLTYITQGIATVTWIFSDGNGNASMQLQTVVVKDITPPSIKNVTASPNLLWPPNHKMMPVVVDVSASDNCDVAPVCKITTISSNEPVDGTGDGDATPDWDITGNLTVNLRAERAGTGNGRTYTLMVQCTDTLENSSTKTVAVTVPHNKGRK